MKSRIRVKIRQGDNEHARKCHLGARGITVKQWIVNIVWLEAIGFHLRDRDDICMVLTSCSVYCDAQQGLACPFETPRDNTPSAYMTHLGTILGRTAATASAAGEQLVVRDEGRAEVLLIARSVLSQRPCMAQHAKCGRMDTCPPHRHITSKYIPARPVTGSACCWGP
jgi:hypothetical protein